MWSRQRESVLGTNFLKEAPGSFITNSRIPRNFSIALFDRNYLSDKIPIITHT